MNKTIRQFECRDDLWERVVALAHRRGLSTDDIVQAALIQLFTRKKSEAAARKNAAGESGTSSPAESASAGAAPSASASNAPVASEPQPASTAAPSGAAVPTQPAEPEAKARSNRPPPPPKKRAEATPVAVATPEPEVVPAAAVARPLYLFCEGSWHTIDQDQFVIGRGSKFSDLAIKDANISRRHCAVVRRNGEYFLKDLGSTNGVEFDGRRVDDHRVEEGHVYRLCDHELRFSYVSPA